MVHPDNPGDLVSDRTTAVESKDRSDTDSRLWRPHTPNVSDLDSQTPRSPRHRTSGTAAAVAKVHAERPDATAAEIALEVGVTERHVRRLMTSGLLHDEGVVVRDR
jgi:HD-GYP domain-containing protein (c-di-GMP phosphodiesterase class II)